jgi:hypothetical protein
MRTEKLMPQEIDNVIGGNGQRAEPEPRSVAAPWPELDPAALTGLAGRIVETIAPQSEADPRPIRPRSCCTRSPQWET